MDEEVARFEQTILFYADAYTLHGPGSRESLRSVSPPSDSLVEIEFTPASDETTPELTPAESLSSSQPPSRDPSILSPRVRSPSFTCRLRNLLSVVARLRTTQEKDDVSPAAILGETEEAAEVPIEHVRKDALEAWQIEAAKVDRSVRILPGVRRLIDSIPNGRYAVATSGAKTYGMSLIAFNVATSH